MEKTYQFEQSEITFVIDKEKNMMVNATEMAKIYRKRVDHFLKTDHAKAFISELELTPFGGRSEPLTKDEIIKTVNGVNTWMHRILALKFAAWMNTTFELWVYSTIDDILFGAYKDDEKTEKEIGRIQAQITQKEKELSDNPLHEEIAKLKKEETKKRSILNARRRDRTQGFRTMFTEAEMNNSE